MSRFRDEFDVISPTGRLVAACVWVAFVVALSILFAYSAPNDPPLPVRIVMLVLVPLPMTAWALLVAYIDADARRRGMPHVMWTLLAIFIPSAIGIILYFVLREPLLRQCANCGRQMPSTFTFCPGCGAAAGLVCAHCQRPAEVGWQVCPYCGTRL